MQRFHLGCFHQLLLEASHDLVIKQPLTVLGERRRMPDQVVGAQTGKPLKQEVVVELLQQQTLRADPIERLQQRGQQQLLRRHRWPAF